MQPAHVQAYDDALALWRGDPLSDFADERWAAAEAARLTELRLAAMTERAQVALTLGRHQDVISDLEPVVAHDPTLESLAGLLMLALYRSGRQADALDVYTRTREVLDEALGLEPSVSLRSLHERVLRQDATLGAQQDMVPAAARASTGSAATSAGGSVEARVASAGDEPRQSAAQVAGPTTAPVTMPAHRSRADEDRTAPTNLPTVLRPLIGRDAQLDSIAELLGGVRLLSLIGAGGAGKTSLALATVVRASANYPDGAFGVRLASVTTADQVPLAFADALGMPLDGAAATRDLRDRLIAFLTQRRMLLLVDNCEHVVDAAAGLVDDILSRCPDLTVIATSREALADTRRGAGHRRPVGDAPGGLPVGRGAELSGGAAVRRTGPRRTARAWCSTPTTCPRSGSSAAPSTASHSPSSSPLPGCRRCRPSRCPSGSGAGSPSSPPGPAPPRSGSRHCAPPSTGATSFCRRPNNGCSTGSRSSRAVGH